MFLIDNNVNTNLTLFKIGTKKLLRYHTPGGSCSIDDMPAIGYSNKNTEHSDCDSNNQYNNSIFYFFRIFFKILFIKNTLNCFTASSDCRTHAKDGWQGRDV